MGEIRAHGTEQHTGNAAASARADDEESSLLADEAPAGVAVQNLTRQCDVVGAGERLGARELAVGEAPSRRVIRPLDEAGVDHRRRRLPRMDQHDGVAGSGVLERPADCSARGGRAVDTDDDPLRSALAGASHGFRPRSSRLRVAEFVMTDRLDSAMAAAAIIGFRSPAAAIGIAALL